MDAAPRFRVRAGLVLSGQGATRYLTDLASGQVYELNDTALLVFEALQRGASVHAAAEALARKYPEVPRGEIDRDARELVDDMVRSGVLERA